MIVRRPWPTALVVALAVGLTLASVGIGWEVYFSTRPAGSVTLDGSITSIRYAPGSPQPFGPSVNLTCQRCPVTLSGGSSWTLFVLWMNLTYAAIVYYNVTIYSAIPFHELGCSGFAPCPLTNVWNEWNQTWTNGRSGGVSGLGWPVQLSVPSPAPNLQGGFWITTVADVHVVPS